VLRSINELFRPGNEHWDKEGFGDICKAKRDENEENYAMRSFVIDT
jgi:hypothetical protein